MKMKRTISLLLVLAALMTMLPMTAAAADSNAQFAPMGKTLEAVVQDQDGLVVAGEAVESNGIAPSGGEYGKEGLAYVYLVNGTSWRAGLKNWYGRTFYVNSWTWRSSNTRVATVTSAGRIYAKGAGTCYVYLTYYGRTYSWKVKVYPRAAITSYEYNNYPDTKSTLAVRFYNNDATKSIKQIRFRVQGWDRYGYPRVWYKTVSGLYVRRHQYKTVRFDCTYSLPLLSGSGVTIDRIWYANGTTYKP